MFIIHHEHCLSDNALNYFQSNLQENFKMTPKIWHIYIRIFMYRYFKWSQFEKNNIHNVLFYIHTYSFIYIKLRDKSLESRGLCQSKKSYEMNVIWTSGLVYMSVLAYKDVPYTLKLNFKVNLELRLNMTFHVLHLREVVINDCKYDMLEVYNSNYIKGKYKYCGYYSNFNLYPEFNDFIIIITLHLRLPFHVHALFSVTDKQLIFNPLDPPGNLDVINDLIKIQCFRVGGQYFVTSFFITIVKFYRVHLKIINSNAQHFVIYDGPGYHFSILNKTGDNSVSASTFQCLVQFLVNNTFQWYTGTLFRYSYIKNDNTNFKKFDLESDVIIHIPFINCLSNFCVYFVDHKEGLYLNFTVLNVSVNSPETSNCLFQGLHFGEHWKNSYFIIEEMCSEFNIASEKSMSTYHTRGSSLWMTLYWYKGYTSITAVISVSATKCQGVYLNICRYHQYCTKSDYHKYFNPYINIVTRHTKIQFDDCLVHRQRQYFKLQAGECVLLILSDKFDPVEELNDVCKITLSMRKDEGEIIYIDGYLGQGNYVEIVNHKDCLSSKQSMCQKMHNDKDVSFFQWLKFVEKFKEYLSNKIDTTHVQINSRQYTNQVNIMLIGLRKTRPEVVFGLVAYQHNAILSDVLFGATLELRYAMGLDWILSTNINKLISFQHRYTLCRIAIQTDLFFIFKIFKWFSTHAGKLMLLIYCSEN